MIHNDGFSVLYSAENNALRLVTDLGNQGATDSAAINTIRAALATEHPAAYASLVEAECRFEESPLLARLACHGTNGLAALASALRLLLARRFTDVYTLRKPVEAWRKASA